MLTPRNIWTAGAIKRVLGSTDFDHALIVNLDSHFPNGRHARDRRLHSQLAIRHGDGRGNSIF